MRKDPVLGLIGLAILATLFISLLGANGILFLTILGVVLFAAIYLFLAPKCPSCEARWSMGHLHQRVDGGPDRRYNHNPVVCKKCGWPIVKP